MKRIISMILVLTLFCAIQNPLALGQPGKKPSGGKPGNNPFGGGKPGNNPFGGGKPGGFSNDKNIRNAQIAGLVIGGVLNNLSNRPPNRPPFRPPYRPPYRPPVEVHYVPAPTYVQTPSVVTPATVQNATANAAEQVKPLTLTENPTIINAPLAPKDIVNKAKKDVNKAIEKKLDDLIELLEESVMSEERATAIAQKFISEGKDKKKVSNFLSAINNDNSEFAEKIVMELTDDPLEGMKIAGEISLSKKIAEFSDSIESDEFSKQDSKELEKLISKANLPSKTKKEVKKIINILESNLEVLEILKEYKPSTKTTILAPTGVVTVIYCPSLQQDVAYALDDDTYIVNGNEVAKDEEDISGSFPKVPAYNNPISQSTQQISQISLTNSTSRTATYHLDDNISRKLESGKKATFDVPSSGVVHISSQGRWKAFTIGAGNYDFDYTGGAWSVVSKPITVTLDNSANPLPFTCFIDRTEYTIDPGDRISFTSSNGILDIQFARNENTNNRASYIIEESVTYKIGLDQKDNKWALFQ
ncbi:MAG: hypothetical protein LBP59_15920 [Planctomycetaceae bacterium]|jgi:hypothetical protein|nr:hypothetical protein [Planctomycetaceae bacterium]